MITNDEELMDEKKRLAWLISNPNPDNDLKIAIIEIRTDILWYEKRNKKKGRMDKK